MYVKVKKTNRNVGFKKLRRFSELYIGSRYRQNCVGICIAHRQKEFIL